MDDRNMAEHWGPEHGFCLVLGRYAALAWASRYSKVMCLFANKHDYTSPALARTTAHRTRVLRLGLSRGTQPTTHHSRSALARLPVPRLPRTLEAAASGAAAAGAAAAGAPTEVLMLAPPP